ncbi:MAG: hypothetical protein AB7T37_08260 [Dehalococcoidia bacterium]
MSRSAWFLLFGATTLVGLTGGALYGAGAMSRLLPADGGHGAWYASRAAGVASYLFIWLGLVGGLLMSSAWFDGFVGRARLLAIHQVASMTGIALGSAHGLVLIPDGWTQFGLFDVLVPFGSYYDRSVTAIGQLALYLGVLVSASFWVRSAIGTRAWRLIHYTSFVVYGGALWHGLQMGTDSSSVWLLSVYFLTSAFVMVALTVRITFVRQATRRASPAGQRPMPADPLAAGRAGVRQP